MRPSPSGRGKRSTACVLSQVAFVSSLQRKVGAPVASDIDSHICQWLIQAHFPRGGGMIVSMQDQFGQVLARE